MIQIIKACCERRNDMEYIRMIFERGGELTVGLDEKKAPQTVKSILESIPCESILKHSRWCGREIYLDFYSRELPPKENNTCIVSKFDVAYWRESWSEEGLGSVRPGEALSFYYGPEHLSYHGGFIHVNVIGRVLWEQEEMLDKIGKRIWQSGIEKVWLERL